MEFIVDGKSVFVYTGTRAINPTLPSIVFVHGAALDHSVWTLPSRYFAHHGHNVLAVDLPGHGRSKGEPLSSIGEMADWLLRLLDAAGLKEAAVVGHSMGSLIALETAATHPERVSTIVLLGTSVPMPVSESLLTAAEINSHTALDMINIWGHSHRAQLGGNLTPGLWMSGIAIRLLERSAPGVLYNDLKACNEYVRGLESGAQVNCPALLILGRQDLMAPPRAATDLLKAIPGAKSVVLEDCGHMMLAEQPDAVLDALIAVI